MIHYFLLVFWRMTQAAVSEDSRVLSSMVHGLTICWILAVNFLLGHFQERACVSTGTYPCQRWRHLQEDLKECLKSCWFREDAEAKQ